MITIAARVNLLPFYTWLIAVSWSTLEEPMLTFDVGCYKVYPEMENPSYSSSFNI